MMRRGEGRRERGERTWGKGEEEERGLTLRQSYHASCWSEDFMPKTVLVMSWLAKGSQWNFPSSSVITPSLGIPINWGYWQLDASEREEQQQQQKH